MAKIEDLVFVNSLYLQRGGRKIYRNRFAETVQNDVYIKDHLSRHANISYGPAIIDYHDDGELRIDIRPNVRRKHVYLFHPFRGYDGEHDSNIGDKALRLILDGIAGVGRADKITLVAPYLPYGRGDWPDGPRVPVPAKQEAVSLEEAAIGKLAHVFTFDMHANQAIAYFGHIRPDNLPFVNVFVDAIRDDIISHRDNLGSLSLDAGGGKRNEMLYKRAKKVLGGQEIPSFWIDKRRPRPGDAKVAYCSGEPENLVLLSFDDIAGSVNTISVAAKATKEKGASRLIVAATHGILSDRYDRRTDTSKAALDTLRESGAMLYVSNSLPHAERLAMENPDILRVLSLEPTVARAIYETETGGSVSALYRDSEDRNEYEGIPFTDEDGQTWNIAKDGSLVKPPDSG
ncbi:MAG: ribose-phosphate pyrophosphokinase [Candidatus Aenigmarchaeota archaeon]|nr:ribose-phosphate pyrophosphokinase [Candidatus Aenigmarchaeota archaeon]